MAVSKLIKVRAEGLYTGDGTYINNIGTTITLSKDIRRYSALRLELFVGTVSSSTRRVVAISNMFNNFSAAYFLYATPTGSGSIRIEAIDKSLTLLSATDNDMYLHSVTAY